MENQKLVAIYFSIVFVFISHVVLPYYEKNEVLYFFTWSLFSSYSKEYNEIIYSDKSEQYLLSDPYAEVPKLSHKHTLWFLSQMVQFKENDESNKKILNDINVILAHDGLKFLGVCKIEKSLPQYIQLRDKRLFLNECISI